MAHDDIAGAGVFFEIFFQFIRAFCFSDDSDGLNSDAVLSQ